MARKRMIDPNIWQSEDFGRLSTLAKIVFIGLFSNADDAGRGRAKPAYIKSILFPYDEGIRVIDVDKTLSEIGSNMSVTFYSHDGNEYYSLTNWSKWQKVDKPTPSVIPAFEENSAVIRRMFDECSTNSRRVIDEASLLIEKNRTEENRIEQNIYSRVISYLNKKCSTDFKDTSKKTQQLIKARLEEGFKAEDFKTVIDKKSKTWLNTDMSKYLRPETLFGTKFEGYLNEKIEDNYKSDNKHYNDNQEPIDYTKYYATFDGGDTG